MTPLGRAIFSIFFVHSLNSEIDLGLRRNSKSLLWMPGAMATLFIVLTIVGTFLTRVSSQSSSIALNSSGIIISLCCAYPLVQAQKAANLASDDVAGNRNSEFTALNWLWMSVGALFWVLLLFGLYLGQSGKIPAVA